MRSAKQRPLVKICGLRRAEDVQLCIRHGADIVGFVVEYPKPVPWNVTADEAKTLLDAVNLQAETCIVTGGTAEHVCKLAAKLRPSYIQHHWETTAADLSVLTNALSQLGVKLIQAIFPHTPNFKRTAIDFCRTGVHALLLDPRTPDHAGQGGTADIALWRNIQNAVTCPVILAGGITHENIADFIGEPALWMIDLMTGVEQSPGRKDEPLVKALFHVLEGLSK